MKFNRIFYDSKIDLKSITVKQVALSIFIGLASAFLIYSFFGVLREVDRYMFLDFENRPVIVPETERQFYNLFFAAISMIIGNSMFISFLISRPQKLFSKRNNKRFRILNDQVFLGFNFIYWFAKIWFLFAAFAFEIMSSKFLDSFLLPSILLILVLYLESWKTLIRVIKKNRWKIQITHLIVFIILTFALSKINIVDYKSIDDSILKSNPTIDVPFSIYDKDNHRTYNYEDFVFKMDFNSEKEVTLFALDNKPIEFYNVYSEIERWKSENFYEHYRFSPRLRANKNLPIRKIKELELKLLNIGEWKIIYEIVNVDELTSRYFNNQIKHQLSPSLQEEFVYDFESLRLYSWDFHKEQKFNDTIQIHISRTIKILDEILEINELSEKLKEHISKSTIVEYVYSDIATYQDFINVLSAHKTAVWELRVTDLDENYTEDELLFDSYRFRQDPKLKKERIRLREKFPVLVTETFE